MADAVWEWSMSSRAAGTTRTAPRSLLKKKSQDPGNWHIEPQNGRDWMMIVLFNWPGVISSFHIFQRCIITKEIKQRRKNKKNPSKNVLTDLILGNFVCRWFKIQHPSFFVSNPSFTHISTSNMPCEMSVLSTDADLGESRNHGGTSQGKNEWIWIQIFLSASFFFAHLIELLTA